MPQFLPISFVDLSHLTATLLLKYRPLWHENEIALRDEGRDMPCLEEWKAARAAISRLSSALSPLFGGGNPHIQNLSIRRYLPGVATAWDMAPESHLVRAFACLLPSPGGRLYSGLEVVCPQVGSLTLMDRSALHSAVNFGPSPMVLLVADIERPQNADNGLGAS